MGVRWLAGIIGLVFLTACGGSSGDDDDTPTVPLAYMAVGASDAAGVGAVPPLENGYVFRIEDALENERGQPVDLTNVAFPGGNADDILGALNLAMTTGVSPDLVTVWTGANDLTQGRSPAAFQAELDAILARLRGTGAMIFIGDLPDLTALPRFVAEPDPDVTPDRVAAFNAVIETLAARYGATVVRLSAVPLEADLTSDVDGFHPSNAGHARIAEAFLQAIRPALGLPAPAPG